MKKLFLIALFTTNVFAIDTNSSNESYQKDCDNGNAFGCFMLDISFSNGSGVKQDYVKANELYQKACELKALDACDLSAILSKLLNKTPDSD
jgi:TPR repeat protein